MKLETYSDYNYLAAKEILEEQGFSVMAKPVHEVDLVQVEKGAAMECIDGRHGKRYAKKHAPKIPGGTNFIASQITGGDQKGFEEANDLALEKLGLTHGTHKRCGFFDKWANRQIMHVVHEFQVQGLQLTEYGHDLGNWIRFLAKRGNGKHFVLPGEHEERIAIVNPHIGTTTKARPDSFAYDAWVIPILGGNHNMALRAYAETVAELSAVRTMYILNDPRMYY